MNIYNLPGPLDSHNDTSAGNYTAKPHSAKDPGRVLNGSLFPALERAAVKRSALHWSSVPFGTELCFSLQTQISYIVAPFSFTAVYSGTDQTVWMLIT